MFVPPPAVAASHVPAAAESPVAVVATPVPKQGLSDKDLAELSQTKSLADINPMRFFTLMSQLNQPLVEAHQAMQRKIDSQEAATASHALALEQIRSELQRLQDENRKL